MSFRFSFPSSLHTINQEQLPRDLRKTRNWFVTPIGGDRARPITLHGEHSWDKESDYLFTFEDACSTAEEINQTGGIFSDEYLALGYLFDPESQYVGIKLHSCSGVENADVLSSRFESLYSELVYCFMNQAIVKAEIPDIAGKWFSLNGEDDVSVSLCNYEFMFITSDATDTTSTLKGVQPEMDRFIDELMSSETRSRPATANW